MRFYRALFILLFPAALFAQGLPALKAQVGEPVLQELMGGCSMACAFPWETTATVPGKAAQPVYKLNDSDASTAWIDPNPAPGTRLAFQFPKKLPKEMNGTTPFYGFDIANGFTKSPEVFKTYSRVKKAKLFFNGKPMATVTFADSRRWQHVNFDDLFPHQGDTFSMEISEVYPGSKSSCVAITQLVLQGAH